METITVRTNSRVEFVEISGPVRQWLETQDVQSGVLTIYVPHTTAGVTINEHADPDVVRDLTMELNKVIPFEDNYRHLEGNAAAHIKSSLIGASAQIIVENGDLVLGTWQGIFFAEFDGPRTRKVHLQLTGA
jgi:secondary thiamine-phosphate synthase enzyme